MAEPHHHCNLIGQGRGQDRLYGALLVPGSGRQQLRQSGEQGPVLREQGYGARSQQVWGVGALIGQSILIQALLLAVKARDSSQLVFSCGDRLMFIWSRAMGGDYEVRTAKLLS